MRPLAVPALFALAVFIQPANAQIAGSYPREPVRPPNPFIGDSRLPGPGVGRELRDIRGRIDEVRDSGAISKREAKRLDREARQIGRLARRYGRDGLSGSERAELEARSLYLRGAVSASRSGSGRGPRLKNGRH